MEYWLTKAVFASGLTFEVAADWFAEVLADDAHEGPGEEDDHAALVEQLEEPVVDITLIEPQVLGDVTH